MATSQNSAVSSDGKSTITFYAKALNERGQIEQVRVTKEPGKPSRPTWTGKIYRSEREADADLIKLNGAIARQRAPK
jgi:hypothetical protein